MNNDRIQAKFTNWLDTLAYRTKLNYIRNEKKYSGMVSIDEMSEDRLEQKEFHVEFEFSAEGEFNFESEWLEKAFSELSEHCKEILTMLFVQGKSTTEIAAHFNCTVRNINWHKEKAFEIIRNRGENK